MQADITKEKELKAAGRELACETSHIPPSTKPHPPQQSHAHPNKATPTLTFPHTPTKPFLLQQSHTPSNKPTPPNRATPFGSWGPFSFKPPQVKRSWNLDRKRVFIFYLSISFTSADTYGGSPPTKKKDVKVKEGWLERGSVGEREDKRKQ